MRTLVFDVIETLLDLSALDPLFVAAFGTAQARTMWFNQMLQSALVATITETYRPFDELGRAALQMTAQRLNRPVSDEQMKSIGGAMRELPPHPDVRNGLSRLRDGGFRLAALTNSRLETLEAQLRHAGLREFFEAVLSADDVKRYKPAREVYVHAAARLEAAPAELTLVAAHDWDVRGAMRAGFGAVFLARPGRVLDPLQERPAVVAADLGEAADRLLAQRAAV